MLLTIRGRRRLNVIMITGKFSGTNSGKRNRIKLANGDGTASPNWIFHSINMEKKGKHTNLG
jgi:phage tail sheath gpL-like